LSLSCLLTGVLVFLTSATAQTLPAEYFGGSDHDAYVEWLAVSVNNSASRYTNSIFLPTNGDPSLGAAVHWSIEGDSVFLAVAARATGWVGFGLSENGGMQGSDVVLFTAAEPDVLVDSYILEARFPVTDDNCPNNWTLLNSSTDGGFLIWEGTRLLDTGDPQDRVIRNDADGMITPSRIIAAWGDSQAVSYHGTTNRVRGSVRWFAGIDSDTDEQAIFQAAMQRGAEGSFEVRASSHPIKQRDTEYVNFCASREDILAQGAPDVDKMIIVGFEPIIDDNSGGFVHHYTVTGSISPNNGFSQTCGGDFEEVFDLTYVWAPGDGPFALPDYLGAPFGGIDGFQSYKLEIHYNNPGGIQGVLDNSGVRFYYTTQTREFELGVLQLGDPIVNLVNVPVGNGLSSHAFSCPGDCSSEALQGQPVTIIRENLHMHRSGTRMVNEQIRDGQVIREGVVDFFNFDQNGNIPVQQEPFEVLPGDSFNTVCYYRGQNSETFGISSQDEMCIAFIYYYPRKTLYDAIPWVCGYDLGVPGCDVEWTARTLTSDADLQRTFGASTSTTATTECRAATPKVPSSSPTSNAELVTPCLSFLVAASTISAMIFL
jgi:hypothetical protein